MSNKKDKEMKTTLRIVGEINIETLKTFFDETDAIIEAYEQYKAESALVNPLYLQSFPAITIDISSYGGCTDCGSAIIHRMDEMKEMGIQVNTHCHFAYSMAFIIFVNGMKRTGDKLSKFMNHGSASYNRGYVEEQRASIEFSTKCDEQFEQIIYENTKMPKDRVERARLCYDWIDYDESIELGIINDGYEGCEPDWDELDEKYTKAVALSIQTFAQLMETEDEDTAIELLYLGLADILEGTQTEDGDSLKEALEEALQEIADMEVVEEEDLEEDDEDEEIYEEEDDEVVDEEEDDEDEDVEIRVVNEDKEEHLCEGKCDGDCGDKCKCHEEVDLTKEDEE